MQPATARVARVWRWLPATPAQKTKRCAALLCFACFACLLSRVAASISPQPVPPSILPTRLIPTLPPPPLLPPPPARPLPSTPPPVRLPSPHRYANTCDFACQAPAYNPARITPAAPRGDAASVTTAHAAAVEPHPCRAAGDQPREPSPPPARRHRHPRSIHRPADGTLAARLAHPEHIIAPRCTTRARRLAWTARRAIANRPCKLPHAHTRPPASTSETAPALTTACRPLPTTIAAVRHLHRPAGHPDPCRHPDAIAPPPVTTTQ